MDCPVAPQTAPVVHAQSTTTPSPRTPPTSLSWPTVRAHSHTMPSGAGNVSAGLPDNNKAWHSGHHAWLSPPSLGRPAHPPPAHQHDYATRPPACRGEPWSPRPPRARPLIARLDHVALLTAAALHSGYDGTTCQAHPSSQRSQPDRATTQSGLRALLGGCGQPCRLSGGVAPLLVVALRTA